MRKEKQQKIDSTKPKLKEKACYALAATLFVLGGGAWVASLGLGFSGTIDPFAALGMAVGSWALTGAGFAVGTAGTPIERGIDENEAAVE